MKKSPQRSVASLLALATLFNCTGGIVEAQPNASPIIAQAQGNAEAHAARPVPAAPPLSRIVPPRLLDAPGGARVTIASDAPLDDYTSRLDGENFYVLIPHAEASFSEVQFAGHGFTSAGVEQRGDNVILSFHLQTGASVRVNRGFNRLDVLFKTQPQPQPGTTTTKQPAAVLSKTAEAPITAALTNGSDEEREVIRQMRTEIEALEARIKEIESKQAAQGGGPQQTTAQALPENSSVAASRPGVGMSHPDNDGEEHDDMSKSTPALQIQGFADVNFRASNQKGATNAFALGQLDLFLTSRLSDKFSVLGELIIEAAPDNSFSFEIHRLLLRYTPNDYFNFSAGRYHTAIGYYNTAYHHGSWFQTAANRPFIYAFESKGGILPLHNVGLSITGRIPSAPFGLRYVAELGNGRASRSPLDKTVQTSTDENNGKAFNLGIFARPKTLPGFQTGFSIYRDSLTPRTSSKVGQTIMAAHIIYQNRLWELLNEAVFIRHAVNDRVFLTPGFYTQASRRFGNARPYIRYQYVNVPEDDPIYPDVRRRNGPSVGLRYDISDFAAFKAQYDRTERRRLSSLDELILQLAFTF